jgi:hypothetical protein
MSKKFNKFSFVIILVSVFFLGILAERHDVDKKASNNIRTFIDQIYQYIYSLSNNGQKLYLFIEPRHYRKILNIRDSSIEKTMLTKDLEDWVPARLSFIDNSKNIKIKLWFDNFIRNSPEGKNKEDFIDLVKSWIPEDKLSNKNNPNIQIRLKGAWPEHWSDEKQWSFKIKFYNEKDQLLNLNRLALQPPWTLDYIYEWLLYKALENENLISLPVSFSEVILNNKSLGAYVIQGQVSEKLLIKNGKPISPVIGFTKDTWIKEQINTKKLNKVGGIDSLNGLEDTFWRSRIEPVQFNKFKGDIKQENYLKKAIYLLESFRNGKITTSKVFDIEKLAKVMALRALLGSSEFDYLDTKFYYNPKTSLLEPITKEAHVNLNLNWKEYYFSWWIDSSKIRPHYTNNTNFFIDLLYKDKKFYAAYLKQLNYYASINFYQKLIKNNEKEFKKNLKILKMNYPTKKIFSEDHLKVTRARVQDLLSPVEGLNAYFENYSEGILSVTVQNIQRLPIEIIGIELDNGKKIFTMKDNYIKGKRPLNPSKSHSIKFNCEDIICNKDSIAEQKVLYKILGQTKQKMTLIKPFYFSNNQ